jgi:hypothetical protein
MAAIEQFHWVYAAKFLCGEVKPMEPEREGPVESGRYATAINVHNPNPRPVGFRKKAVLLFDGSHPEDALERPVKPMPPAVRKLGPDFGLEIDCRDIREVLLRVPGGPPGPPAPTFIKGWVVIETLTDVPLDVVAVYTAEALGAPETEAPSIAVDRVTGNRIRFPTP